MGRNRWIASVLLGVALAGFLWAEPWEAQAGADGADIKRPDETTAAASYHADIQIDAKAHKVTGTVAVRFVPRDREAYFHLYPNAFRQENDLSGANWEQVLGKQREPGGIAITNVAVNGQPVPFRFLGKADTLLQVPLPKQQADTQTEVQMAFQLNVPYNNGRLSYNDHAMWLGNWLPILAIKEADGWRLDSYMPIGDPFYSDTAHYHLRVQIPQGYQLATSGVESVAVVTKTRPQGQTTYEIDAWNVRDFALVVMDDTYRQTSSKEGEVVVRTWSQEGDDPQIVNRLHQVALQAIRYYSEQFGDYPYQEYDVVKTGGFFGGMEYPSLVFIQDDFFNRTDPMGEAVVAHETAHQWFYGLVGSDEVREAWVDESMTDYAAMAFLQQYDAARSRAYVSMRLARSRAAEAYAKEGLTAWQSVGQFPDWKSYSDLVYSRGGAMWWTLKEAWGTDRLHGVLRHYVRAHQYGQASGKQVVDLLSEAAGADATPFFDYWLRLQIEKEKQANEWLEKGKHE